MDASKLGKNFYDWWAGLLRKGYGDSVLDRDPLDPKNRIGLLYEEGVVYFGIAPKYWFFSFNQIDHGLVLATFMPEIDAQVRPEVGDEFCNHLELHLNKPFERKQPLIITNSFTLPVGVEFTSRNFREQEYDGVLMTIETAEGLFLKDSGLSKRALDGWKKKIFGPCCKFSADNANKYLKRKE